MLDPWIIEEIRREEEARQRDEERSRPVLEIPQYEMPSTGETKPASDDPPSRGVVIVDLSIG